ncbi:MAG: VOC family protein [Actinomycetota bacterium]|nr:VOC family protein [Actinomycetota bacterium]
MLSLNTIMIGTEEVKPLRDFYTKLLGEPGWDDEGFVGWQAGSGMIMIGAHSEVKGRNEMPGRIILNFETTDVKKEFERIKGLGATVVQEPYPPSESMPDFLLATFADPDGNYFQLATPMPAQ